MILKRLLLIYSVFFAFSATKVYSQISKNTAVSINITADEMYYFIEGEKISLYCAKKENGVWLTGIPEESFNQNLTSWHSAKTPFISYDGNTLYFSAKEKEENNFDLYYTKRENGVWQNPIKMNISDPKVDDMAPSVSSDNKTLYFAKQNESGCYSIFYSNVTSFGSWSAPMSLPIPITVGCENYPLINADGSILFFSSDRASVRKTKKYQIYYSRLVNDGIWSAPEPISSGIDYEELAPAIDYYKGEMHVTRFANGKADLYVFKLNENLAPQNFTVYKGIVKKGDAPVSATIEVARAFDAKVIGTHQSDPKTGEYLAILPSKGYYILKFKADKTEEKSIYVSAENASITKDIDLIEAGKVKINIYDFNSMEAIDARISVEGIEVAREALGIYKFILPLDKTARAYISKAGYEQTEIDISSKELQFSDLEYGIALKPSLQTYELKINDATTNEPIAAKIILKSRNSENPEEIKTIADGFYSADIPKEEKYDLYVFSKGYMYFRNNIETEGDRLRESLRVNLIPLNKVGRVSLDKISFIPNTDQLTRESRSELYALVELLKINPTVKTEFTVYYTNSTLGKYLAEGRSSTLLSYFNSHKISSDRIILKSAVLKDETKGVIEATLSF